jgi:acetyl-CoA acetyltransferase
MEAVVDPNILANDVFEVEGARNCLMNMGMTAENVAEKYGITRDVQD